jgi:uncharacterized protein (TIGR02145 family)
MSLKKLLTSTLLLIAGLSLSAQTDVDALQADVDTLFLTKDNLGIVSFVSDKEWIIEGNGITQIWSDAVRATSCDKEDFIGHGISDNSFIWIPDCRSTSKHRGDLFSWRAVFNLDSLLCPAPWRVPTAEDFCNLDKILTERDLCNNHAITPEKMIATYVDRWGASFDGVCARPSGMQYVDLRAYYWSISEYDKNYAYYLTIDVHGNIQSRSTGNAKLIGASLRCIR